jgi:hypothetical protein
MGFISNTKLVPPLKQDSLGKFEAVNSLLFLAYVHVICSLLNFQIENNPY